jgi:AAA family ATP:ADP antiporter
VLRPIAEVRPGEAGTALLLTLNVFLLLSAYYFIKPVREALILSLESGAEYKAYMSGVIAIVLLFAVPAYAKLADRLPRLKLVVGVTLGFAAQLVLFFVAAAVPGLRERLGLVFYVWVGIFNMMVVAQFWSYANDLYDTERGTRLFPLVAVGASVGAAVGSQLSALLIPLFGVSPMLLVAALVLGACALLFLVVEHREAQRVHAAAPAVVAADASRGKPPSGAFGLVLSHRYLVLLALFSLVFSWVNSNGEYMLGKLFKAEAEAAVKQGTLAASDVGKYIGAAYGQFFTYVNVGGVLLQAFVVSRLVRFLGFPLTFLVMPAIAFGSALSVALIPVLAVLRIGKIVENATDYSLNNTLRQMTWLVTSKEMKYKAKQAVDTFFVRMGDVSAAISVWVGVGLMTLPVQRFAWLSGALACIWQALAIAIGRSFAKREAAGAAKEVPT